MKIPFCRIACEGNEMAYVRDVLASGWLTTEELEYICAVLRGG
ncbi:MAG: hypothetical protein ABSG73_12040 [Candidatus Aminicenantales bacterium]